MALYPEVQAKAQSEIDRVIGSDRLPGFQDRDSLPYLNALTKEVLRWNPVSPLGTGCICGGIAFSHWDIHQKVYRTHRQRTK